MAYPKLQRQHLGAVTTLVQAAREARFRSVAITGLFSRADNLAEVVARDLSQDFGLSTTLFRFQMGQHRWRQFSVANADVHQTVSARGKGRGLSLSGSIAMDGPPADMEGPEIELAPDTSFGILRATIQELETETSMLIMDAPALLSDPEAMMALSVVPQVILEVHAPSDREDLIAAGKSLEAMKVNLIGTVLTGYRNPLPKWLDYLLGYR